MHRVYTEQLTPEEKRKMWDSIIEDYLSSGEKQKQYSRSQGLKYDHLHYYVSAYKNKKSSSFIPIELPQARNQEMIRVELGHITLMLPLTIQPAMLTTIISDLLKC